MVPCHVVTSHHLFHEISTQKAILLDSWLSLAADVSYLGSKYEIGQITHLIKVVTRVEKRLKQQEHTEIGKTTLDTTL